MLVAVSPVVEARPRFVLPDIVTVPSAATLKSEVVEYVPVVEAISSNARVLPGRDCIDSLANGVVVPIDTPCAVLASRVTVEVANRSFTVIAVDDAVEKVD